MNARDHNNINTNNSNYSNSDHLRNMQQCTTSSDRVNLTREEYRSIQTCHQTALYCTSSWSNEENLSYCLAVDEEVQSYMVNATDSDELPAFQIRLISPCSHSPSPISNICSKDMPSTHLITDLTDNNIKNISPSSFIYHNNTDFVALQDINAQISLPNEQNEESIPTTTSNLETIYEGVFLHTPPRQLQQHQSTLQYQRFQRHRNNYSNAFLDIVVERGKENISPVVNSEI